MGQRNSREENHYDSDHASNSFTDSDVSNSPEVERLVFDRQWPVSSAQSTATPSMAVSSAKFPDFPEFLSPIPDEFPKDGLTLSGHVLPQEVLSIILSKVDVEYLPTCRSVCRTWRCIIDSDIWRYIHPFSVYRQFVSAEIYSFSVHYVLHKKKPFNKNLIKNPCGSEEYRFWNAGVDGWCDGWSTENPPQGADPVPVDDISNETHCFATSFQLCFKSQEINLSEIGVAPIIMDKLKPTIYISDWYAARFDCACEYNLHVTLLNEERTMLDEFRISRQVEQWEGRGWNQVSHEFKDYPEGVRSIVFYHSGKDRQFWKGYYGSKMTKSCIKLIL